MTHLPPRRAWLIASLLALSGCSTTIQTQQDGLTWPTDATWAVLPLVNLTDTPQAALSAEALVLHELRLMGLQPLNYPLALGGDSLLEPNERKLVDSALTWAKQQKVRYAVLGQVNEWRYKVGVDGEPAVGLGLQVMDLSTQRVVWSATGARSGWSREALSAVAQRAVAELLKGLRAPAPH